MAALKDFYIGTALEASPGASSLGVNTTNTFVIPDDGWLIQFNLELDYPQKTAKSWQAGDVDGSGGLIESYSGKKYRPDLETTQFLQVAIAKASNPLAFRVVQDESGEEIRADASTGRDLIPYNALGNMPGPDAGELVDSITETASWSFKPGQVTVVGEGEEAVTYTSGWKAPTNAVGLVPGGLKVYRGDRIRFYLGKITPSYATSQDQWYKPALPYYAGTKSIVDAAGSTLTTAKVGGLNDLFYYARFTRIDPLLAAPEAEAEPTFTTGGAFGGADLAAIEGAIKSGELRVQYNDRMVVYRSIQELLAARDFIKMEVAAPATTSARVAKQVRFATKRGYGT